MWCGFLFLLPTFLAQDTISRKNLNRHGPQDWKNLDAKLSKPFSSAAHTDAMAEYVAQLSVAYSGGSVAARFQTECAKKSQEISLK